MPTQQSSKTKKRESKKPKSRVVRSYSDKQALITFKRVPLGVLALLVLLAASIGIYKFNQNRGDSQAAASAESRPFDPSHPVYQPVPIGAALLPNSSQIVQTIIAQRQQSMSGGKPDGSLLFDTGSESPPIYVGTAADPLWTINIACNGRTVKVHAPATIKSGSGADYPLIILDQANSIFTISGSQPMEFRMWQATINAAAHTISANGFGVGSYRNDGATLDNEILQNSSFVKRALGQAEACGQNTGSGESYTVGMIRPADIQRGRIDHAMRIAAGYLRGPASGGNVNNKYWHWPALHTEGGSNSYYLADNDSRVPMGARIFLDKSVDVTAVGNAAAAKLTDAKNQAFARMFVRAMQEYGMIPLDGTGANSNFYFEGDSTANWSGLIGPKNAYGSYNDIARAVAAVLPWDKLRVTDASVFAAYGKSVTTNPTPTPPPPTSTPPKSTPPPAPAVPPASITQSSTTPAVAQQLAIKPATPTAAGVAKNPSQGSGYFSAVPNAVATGQENQAGQENTADIPADPLDHSNLSITKIGTQSAVISWNTIRATTAVVEYGPSVSFGHTVKVASSSREHSLNLSDKKVIKPGGTYYVRITSDDGAGTVSSSPVGVFTTVTVASSVKSTVKVPLMVLFSGAIIAGIIIMLRRHRHHFVRFG